MRLEIVSKVSHIMFIPSWSGAKIPLVSCGVCEKKYYASVFPNIAEEAENLRKSTNRRFYHFIGTFLILAFFMSIAILIFSDSRDRQESLLTKIEKITEGQVIVYKLDNGEKTCMYVDGVRGDTVLVRENRLSTNKNVSYIDEPENYTHGQTFYTKVQLRKMLKDEILTKIYLSTTYYYYNPDSIPR
ncbi:hypothetical protein D0T56_03595 [Dysgonomonas sp. 520]|nr:hypothetical protein [Dysgonomonas sp. 520]